MKRGALILVFCLSPLAHAQLVQPPDSFNLRLQPYEPSYFIERYARNDDNAMAAHYSFRYLLTEEVKPAHSCSGSFWKCDWEAYLSYTGDFDFYVFQTRPSSPVINRTNNPAIHIRWVSEPGNWVDLGLEHRSNGQSLDVTTSTVAEQARQAYANQDHAYFDGISRSSNYISFGSASRDSTSTNSDGQEVQARIKWYVAGEESAVVWGPLANRRTRFSDYDRLRITFRKWWDGNRESSIEAVIGDRFASTPSLNADMAWYLGSCWPKLKSLAVYVRAHSGPMFTLSNYTTSQRSIGVGLKLVPFEHANDVR